MADGITIGNKTYKLDFSHRQVRALCNLWKLNGNLTKYNNELQNRLKGMEKNVTFKHIDTIVDIIYAAILGKDPQTKLTRDALYDYLWNNQDEMMQLIQEFADSQAPKKKGKQQA